MDLFDFIKKKISGFANEKHNKKIKRGKRDSIQQLLHLSWTKYQCATNTSFEAKKWLSKKDNRLFLLSCQTGYLDFESKLTLCDVVEVFIQKAVQQLTILKLTCFLLSASKRDTTTVWQTPNPTVMHDRNVLPKHQTITHMHALCAHNIRSRDQSRPPPSPSACGYRV